MPCENVASCIRRLTDVFAWNSRRVGMNSYRSLDDGSDFRSISFTCIKPFFVSVLLELNICMRCMCGGHTVYVWGNAVTVFGRSLASALPRLSQLTFREACRAACYSLGRYTPRVVLERLRASSLELCRTVEVLVCARVMSNLTVKLKSFFFLKFFI